MAEFHFVEDYEKHVARLVRDHPIDEAMSLAVGGAYDIVGRIEAEALVKNGLRDGMRLADIGCGSGRTAVALARRLHIDYDGYDIVQALLDYARSKTPANYKFHMNRAVKLPGPDEHSTMHVPSASLRTFCAKKPSSICATATAC